MAFMEPEVTDKQEWAEVETSAGGWAVPFDVLSKSEAARARRGDFEPLLQYTEGTKVYSDRSRIRKGYGVRLSAPGYMDATEWEVYGSKKEALRRARELVEEGEGDHATKKSPSRATTKRSPAQLDREIAETLAKPGTRHRSSHAKMGRHGYENGQRVAVLDYLGHVIGTGRVRSGDNYPESNEHYTWVTMTIAGETATTEHPTRQVVVTRS